MMANVRLSVCLGPFLIFMSGPVSAATCDSLAALRLLNVTIKASQIVERGAFSLPGTDQTAPVLAIYKALPPFCRVQGVVKPTSDSHIEFEVWLPLENWNGSFQAVGNGGWGGSINYVGRDSAVDRDLASAIQKGYATASTDTGHRGSGAAFAQGHPEKLIDFAYRAVHETAVQSKSIIAAFYGQVPCYSYWNGCSAGGGQGVMEAWRYPNDFDGIL